MKELTYPGFEMKYLIIGTDPMDRDVLMVRKEFDTLKEAAEFLETDYFSPLSYIQPVLAKSAANTVTLKQVS